MFLKLLVLGYLFSILKCVTFLHGVEIDLGLLENFAKNIFFQKKIISKIFNFFIDSQIAYNTGRLKLVFIERSRGRSQTSENVREHHRTFEIGL